MRSKFAPALSAPLLLLAACEDEAADTAAPVTGGNAEGEVLGGTISDDMLPLEQLTSNSPPLEQSSGEAGTGAGEEPQADDAQDDADTTGAEASEEAPAPEENSGE